MILVGIATFSVILIFVFIELTVSVQEKSEFPRFRQSDNVDSSINKLYDKHVSTLLAKLQEWEKHKVYYKERSSSIAHSMRSGTNQNLVHKLQYSNTTDASMNIVWHRIIIF